VIVSDEQVHILCVSGSLLQHGLMVPGPEESLEPLGDIFKIKVQSSLKDLLAAVRLMDLPSSHQIGFRVWDLISAQEGWLLTAI
jgi:hypothetical protein